MRGEAESYEGKPPMIITCGCSEKKGKGHLENCHLETGKRGMEILRHPARIESEDGGNQWSGVAQKQSSENS